MTAVLDIITGAVRLLGAVSQGVPLSAGDGKDGLAALNSMLDSWNINSLMVYTKNFDTYDLVAGKGEYTIGPSGDIQVAPQLRPTNIDRALLRITNVTPNFERLLNRNNDDEWAAISIKSLQGTYPTDFYSTGDFPNLRLFLWPIPTVGNQIVLWTWNQLAQIATVNATLNLPPGYERCIRYNLAMELASEYGIMPTPMVQQTAIDTLAAIKRINSPDYYLGCDAALLKAPAAFNWLTGK